MRWPATGMRVVGIIGLLVGCASGSRLGVYDKPGAPEADVKRDRAACLRASASESDPFRFSGPTIDRETFARQWWVGPKASSNSLPCFDDRWVHQVSRPSGVEMP